MQQRRRQTWQCEQQQSGARHHFTPILQFTVQSARLKENIFEWSEGLLIRVQNTKGWFGDLSWLTRLATKWRWMVRRKVSPRQRVHSGCFRRNKNLTEPSLNGETNRERGMRRVGDVWKTCLNRCTFTVTQRKKWSPLRRRVLFYQRTGWRNQQFCDSSFEGFLLFGVKCWGVCGMLAAEAMWVSSTSKVGQLVPVPLLMCWRGALCGGLRARLKGLRSLLGGGGWIWPTKVGVRTSGPCESCTMSTDLWALVQATMNYHEAACDWPSQFLNVSPRLSVNNLTELTFIQVFNKRRLSEAPLWPQLLHSQQTHTIQWKIIIWHHIHTSKWSRENMEEIRNIYTGIITF